MAVTSLTRRRALGALAGSIGAGVAAKIAKVPPFADDALAAGQHGGPSGHSDRHGSGHSGFAAGGSVDNRANGFDPAELVRDFDMGKTRRLASGRVLREWELVAIDHEIEVAPGVKFPAWTYNGRVPGPTLRCREGEKLRINFTNNSSHPHTIHFHGIHRDIMDGIPDIGAGLIKPGKTTTYEFDAEPFGLHLYHCHASPLARHIGKGLYGAFIVDPKKGRPDADELVMVMSGFDTNFDQANEVYVVNGVGFAYAQNPIKVKRDSPVRIYLVNTLEYDPINSFHLHANFFNYFPTGTSLEPVEFTDTVMQAQGQRGVLELRFPHSGRYMFHAHKTEFAELGWMGFFEVED